MPRPVWAEARQHVGGQHDPAPAQPVAGDASDEQEDDEGHRLGREDGADVGGRAVGEGQDREREGNGGHARADGRGELAEEIEAEVALAQGTDPALQAHVPRC